MKKFFFTIDLEEWFHLEYLKGYTGEMHSKQRFIAHVLPFMESMRDKNISLTVFVVGDIAQDNKGLIKDISSLGHEIGCHSYSHSLVNRMKDKEFREETVRSKKLLEDIVGHPVIGYRAPCFSMDRQKLDILWECGFKYDASLIRFADHKLYNVFDVSDYEKIESLIYRKDEHYVFETPTYKMLGKNIPISGGGYFRLFPLPLMKHLIKCYSKEEDNFIFYIHPFELVSDPLKDIEKSGKLNHFRFQVGRKGNIVKMNRFIQYLMANNYNFITFEHYISTLG